MLLVIVFSVLVCYLQYSAESISIDDLSKERSDVELKTEMTTICEKILSLDKNITTMLKDPPEGQSLIFLNKMYMYNDELIKFLKLAVVHKSKAIKYCKDVYSKGGPDFVDVLIDEDTLKERFKWEDANIKHMYNIRRETYRFWNKLLIIENRS